MIFASDEDMKAYVTWLKDYAGVFKVAIHAWVLMTNHVHLLCTLGTSAATSLMMQALGRRYVQYFNRSYKRTGTLWEGRFRSSLVQKKPTYSSSTAILSLTPSERVWWMIQKIISGQAIKAMSWANQSIC